MSATLPQWQHSRQRLRSLLKAVNRLCATLSNKLLSRPSRRICHLHPSVRFAGGLSGGNVVLVGDRGGHGSRLARFAIESNSNADVLHGLVRP
jgi:hypothetical protein